jgi:hypothetical protein
MCSEVWRVYRRLYDEGPSSCGGATLTVRQEEGTTRLLPGHQLDSVGDPQKEQEESGGGGLYGSQVDASHSGDAGRVLYDRVMAQTEGPG